MSRSKIRETVLSAVEPQSDQDSAQMRLARVKKMPGLNDALEIESEGHVRKLDPGQWADYMDKKTLLPPACPVVPLGKTPEGMAFLSGMGDINILKPNCGKGDLDFLFAPYGAYLFWAWPRMKKDSNMVDNYHAEAARSVLFTAAALKGHFDPNEKVRGRGCWRDRDGGIIYHAGDRVLFKGRWQDPGEIDGHIYTCKEAIKRPAKIHESAGKAGMAPSAARVLKILKSWNWTRPEIDPQMMLGWIVSAQLGGALDHRPVCWVTGQEGSGKSTLYKFINRIMGGRLITAAETTAAFIYQTLREDVLCVMLDEQEADSDTRRTDQIIKLARVSFSGDKLGRGGQDGVPATFALRSSFFASGIVKPSMDAQDESRMVSFQIRPLDDASQGAPYDLAECEGLAAALFERALYWWPRYGGLLHTVRQALISRGYDSRAADTYGNVLACYHLACHDHDITLGELARLVEHVPMDTKVVSWQKLLKYMMTKILPELSNQTHRTLSAQIESYLEEEPEGDLKSAPGLRDLNRRLAAWGLKVAHKEDQPRTRETLMLFIPNNHAGLQGLFKDTKWGGKAGQTGSWDNVLDQIPGAFWIRPRKSVRIGSQVERGRWIYLGDIWAWEEGSAAASPGMPRPLVEPEPDAPPPMRSDYPVEDDPFA